MSKRRKEYLDGIAAATDLAKMRGDFRVDGPWIVGDVLLMTMTTEGAVLTHGEDPTADDKDVSALRDENGKLSVIHRWFVLHDGLIFQPAYAAPEG